MKSKVLKKAMALAVATACMTSGIVIGNMVSAADQVYEFEDGEMSASGRAFDGDKDGNSVAGASGKLVFLQNGGETVSITVTAPSTGMYSFTMGVYAPYGDKIQNLLINGVDQGQISFLNDESGVKEVELGSYKLNEGENTVTIKSSWGWSYIDYLKVKEATLPKLTATKSLTDSKATDETKRLMCYLADNYGSHIISGQQEIYKYGPHDFEYEFKYIQDNTGELPVIRGFDFLNSANILYGSDDGTVDRMIDWANNKNGIVTASWHVTVPKQFESYEQGVTKVEWAQATYDPKATDFDTSKAIVEGTKENTYYMACLEALAGQLKKLQDANVPIILRPLHEAEGGGGENGSWFWWGKSGSKVYKDLWKLTYDTLTNKYDLHNIIWEWNSYAYESSRDWYPGDEYVDLVAYDKYNCTDWSTGSPVLSHNDSAISGTFYNLVEKYEGKKMVAMAENDSIPTLENLLAEKAGWLYFCPWYDGGSADNNFLSNPVFNKVEDLKEIYTSDYCITLDEVPEGLYSKYSLEGFGSTTEPSTQPVTQPTTEPVTQPITDPATDPADQPTTQPVEVKASKYGDVDLNGTVELADVTKLSKYLLNNEMFSLSNEVAMKNADVTHNDVVDSADLSKLLEYNIGKVKESEL